jgi:UPF0042 nucleotide-binding protein
MPLKLISFGHKHGAPPAADMIMDVRFLQNPFWVEELKPGSGLDEKIGAYIESDPAFESFFTDFLNEAKLLLESGDDKTIAAGCTGGRHRSVYVIEKLAKALRKNGIDVTVEHRDLNR